MRRCRYTQRPAPIARTAIGICLSYARLTASTCSMGASTPSGGQNFPGLRRLLGSNAALTFAQLAEELFTEERRVVLGAEPFRVPPYSRPPPYFAVKATTSSEILFHQDPAADRTCPGPDEHAAPRHQRGRTCHSPGAGLSSSARNSTI